jgi:pimeloyl-ACP methyl ester carboxylesterase
MHNGASAALLAVAASLATSFGSERASPVPTSLQHVLVDTGRVRIHDGTLYYEAAGHGSPVVLLHSGNLDSRTWDPQFLAFARSHHVVRYDARGLGRSSPANVSYAAHEDLLALLDSLHIRHASLVGLSGGARIAVDFALAHPDRVDRLVLAEPGLSGWRFRDVGDTSWARDWRAAALRRDSVGMAVSWLTSDWMKPAMEHAELRPRLREWILAGAGNWLGLIRHGDLERVAEPPALGRTRLLRAPTLAIIGSRDLPEIQHIVDTLTATVPNIRRVTFTGAGHMVNLEQADRFTQVVLDFLREAK